MKCNTQKPPKMPKCWDRLPQYERDIITKIMSDTAYEIADKQLADTQEVWIKMLCIMLHDRHNMDEMELLQVIADWKHMYRRNARLKNKEEQDAWLDSGLARCFPETGFPQFRIDEMKEM
jgi:hypothetical protein